MTIDHIALGLSRVTSEYSDKPDFLAYLSAILSQSENIETAGQAILASVDIDIAVGSQLDLIGRIVGLGRSLPHALPLPFFGFDSTANGQPYGNERTNQILYSEQFNNAVWNKSGCFASINVATAPDGTVTAERLTATAGAVAHEIFQGITLSEGRYAQSVYAKAINANWIALSRTSSATTKGAFFNLTTGAVGTVQGADTTAAITAVGNGWYRCSVMFDMPQGASNHGIEIHTADNQAINWNATGTENIFIWGAQFEDTDTATAYIPTTSAPVSVLDPGPGGVFYDPSLPATETLEMADPMYRQFLRARILRNRSKGTAEDFIAVLRAVFPTDTILVNDAVGKLQINIGLDRTTTTAENATLAFAEIMPKPAGVALAVLSYETFVLKFGFDPTGAPYGDDVTGGGGPFAEDTY